MTDVATVQAADFGKLHDLARRGEVDQPEVRSILAKRKMGARPVIVSEVAGQDAAEVSLVENEHVIQALAADRADESLHERVLPRALRRGENLLDPHALYAVPKLLTVDAVAVTQEIGGRGVVREGVHDLLGGPAGGGVLSHVEMDGPAAMVSEHDANEEDA